MKTIIFALFVGCVISRTYVIERSPVAPFECTELRPCRITDLPSSFTTADSVIFVPATTGTSSTFSAVSRTLSKPSITIRAGVTFSGSTIQSSGALAVNVVGVNFVSGSALNCLSAGAITVAQTNFTNSVLNVQTSTALTVSNIVVSGMTGSQNMVWAATAETISNVVFTNCASTNPLLTLATFQDTTIDITGLSILNSTVNSATNSMVLFNSASGKSLTSTLATFRAQYLTAGAAVLEMRVSSTTSNTAFKLYTQMYDFGFDDSSVTKGVVYLNNKDDLGELWLDSDLDSSHNINFNNGAIYNFNTAGGKLLFNGVTSNNDFCDTSNQQYFAICEGQVSEIFAGFTGNVQNSTETGQTSLNCPYMFFSAGTAC
jgi:hypothetical protein